MNGGGGGGGGGDNDDGRGQFIRQAQSTITITRWC